MPRAAPSRTAGTVRVKTWWAFNCVLKVFLSLRAAVMVYSPNHFRCSQESGWGCSCLMAKACPSSWTQTNWDRWGNRVCRFIIIITGVTHMTQSMNTPAHGRRWTGTGEAIRSACCHYYHWYCPPSTPSQAMPYLMEASNMEQWKQQDVHAALLLLLLLLLVLSTHMT